jgi:RHS repeat-associated protein
MPWKSRWTGGWTLRRVVDQPNCGRIQGNQILISAPDQILTRTCICNRLRLVNFPSVPELSEHQNWLGTERVRTTYNGAIALSIDSLPWADGHTPTGDNGDQHDFALMDRDLEDNTEHAQFRQYSTNLGRWMSPDSYNGSYDFTNPQSFNRYTYASNDPANLIDPSGLDGDSPGSGGGSACVNTAISLFWDFPADIGCGEGILKGIESLLGGSSFHGSLKPRPSTTAGWDGNFGESLGIPTTIPQGNLGLAIALGLPSQGCEFGACGGVVLGFGDDNSPQNSNGPALGILAPEANAALRALKAAARGRPGATPPPTLVPKSIPDPELQPLTKLAIALKALGDALSNSPFSKLFPVVVNPCVLDPLASYCNAKTPVNP